MTTLTDVSDTDTRPQFFDAEVSAGDELKATADMTWAQFATSATQVKPQALSTALVHMAVLTGGRKGEKISAVALGDSMGVKRSTAAGFIKSLAGLGWANADAQIDQNTHRPVIVYTTSRSIDG